MKSGKNIDVVELFAGVGGFRVGLENSSIRYKTVWANQWEPGKSSQHAYDCYVSHFGKNKNHVNKDIAIVKSEVPSHDLLVGGFPCQDYSVAHTGAQGLVGKKGILWWEINDILKKRSPNYVLLENVDRLIKSPANKRGRDFGVILRCFYDMRYAVEWRVINAAEYGAAQRRRRVFIFAYKNTTPLYKELANVVCLKGSKGLQEWILQTGFYASEFPVNTEHNLKKQTEVFINEIDYNDLAAVSNDFKADFYNSGVMINGQVFSLESTPIEQKAILLKDIRTQEPVDLHFFLSGSLDKWKTLKGAKRIARVRPNGEPYIFSEGGMCFPDDLEKPSRTMLTSESSVNRSSHVITDYTTGKLRLLTPEECEVLNGFPIDWTNTGMPEKFRYFTMGNALVVPMVTKIGNRLLEII